MGDALYVIFEQCTSDQVFYSGGIDPLVSDYFGRLSLTTRGLIFRDRIGVEKVTRQSIPVVGLHPGGYAPMFHVTIRAHALMFEIAKG